MQVVFIYDNSEPDDSKGYPTLVSKSVVTTNVESAIAILAKHMECEITDIIEDIDNGNITIVLPDTIHHPI